MYGLNDKCCVGGATGTCWCWFCCWAWAGGWFWFWFCRDFLEFHLFGFLQIVQEKDVSEVKRIKIAIKTYTITWRIWEDSKAVPERNWKSKTFCHTLLSVRYLVGGARETKRDQLQHKPCLGIRHHRSPAFLVLCPATGSRLLRDNKNQQKVR